MKNFSTRRKNSTFNSIVIVAIKYEASIVTIQLLNPLQIENNLRKKRRERERFLH